MSHIEEPVTVQLEAFKAMSNLRFIKLIDYKGRLQWSFSSKDVIDKARSCFSFKHLKYLVRKGNKVPCKSMSNCFSFKHLKYLEWERFPCKSLDNIDMGNVVVIKLDKSKLEKLWDGVKKFKKLKVLDVSSSASLTKTGNFMGLENLEELKLRDCENLEELDSSIGCLQKLVDLDLFNCSRLKSLPWKMIGKLTSLQNLDLQNCSNILEISHEIGSLISLKHLDLTNTRFNNLPNSLCQLHQLTVLILSGCTNLKSIPDLPLNIQYVYARNCINLVNLPNSLCQLHHQLTTIDLYGCTNLKLIPDLPPSIEELQATGCNLVNLPSNCSELQFLTELRLNDCCKLGSEGFTQVVTTLRNLQILRMKKCNVSQVSSGIGNLVSLEYLNLSCNTFSSLPESFSNLSKLKKLDIIGCSQLRLLPLLPLQLTHIIATRCGSLDVMPFDSMQNAYIFPSKAFKESRLMSNEGLLIDLSGKELPEWCTYRNSGNNVLSFDAPIQFDHSKLCGLILCATIVVKDGNAWVCPVIYNKTKGTSHRISDFSGVWGSIPLNNTTIVVEAGDTLEVEFHHESVKSGGLRLVYENDVVDSGLVLKDVSITELNDEDVCSFPIQDEECTYYDFFPMVS